MSAANKYRRCAERGLTQAETARELGVSREAVRQAANRHDIDFPDGRRVEISSDQAKLIGEMVAQGKTSCEIAPAIGHSPRFVCYWIKDAGLALRGNRRSPEVEAEIVRLGREGLRQADISKRVGLNRSTVSEVMVAHGIRRMAKTGSVKEGAPRLLSEGLTVKEIAARLGASEGSVRNTLYAQGIRLRKRATS